jgi:hypothetical protein
MWAPGERIPAAPIVVSSGSTPAARPATRPARPAAVRFRPPVTPPLHRFSDFLPSTSWGPRSCPDRVHRLCGRRTITPAHPAVEQWMNDLHRLWTKQGSTGCAPSCPRATHRLDPVVPSAESLLHSPVHCSATRRTRSPRRVKAVTPRCWIGLWESRVKLGTQLGRTHLGLWAQCAELPVLHSDPELSTAPTHRPGGQNSRAELGKRGYPRYPQALLLLPTRESAEFVSKRDLCTTRPLEPGRPSERLDPDRHLLSVPCVRLVPGVLPVAVGGDTESEDSVATAGGGLR